MLVVGGSSLRVLGSVWESSERCADLAALLPVSLRASSCPARSERSDRARLEETKSPPKSSSLPPAMSLPAPTTTTTIHGDVGVLTYAPLDPAAIEASVRSAKAGAVVSFVRRSLASPLQR